MIANRLIKLLIAINFEVFVKIIKVNNKKDFLILIKKEEKPKKTSAV